MPDARSPLELGGVVLDGAGHRPLRRKAFDAAQALGASRDAAARLAAELSDTLRSARATAGRATVSLALEPRGAGLGLRVHVRPTGPGGPPSGTPATAPAGAPVDAWFPLGIAETGAAAVAAARAIVAARGREELVADLEASNEALRRATDEARRTGDAKARFLAHMSHEIRTPMNAIVGMTRLARGTDLTPTQRGYLDKIDAAARHLLGIIDDVLDVSKLEAGRLTLEDGEVAIADVLEDVTTLAGLACRDKGLRFAVEVAADVPAIVRGDALRLRQVLVNLVTNAVKFTAEGGVTVRVTRDPDTAPDPAAGRPADPDPDPAVALRFEVRDTGIGLDEEQRRRLFHAFAQADASITRRFGGTGLGLAICKSLVELMGGEIGVESRPGEGSTFWFHARFAPVGGPAAGAASTARGSPAAPAHEGAAAPGDEGAAPRTGRGAARTVAADAPAGEGVLRRDARILVVEDHRLNQEVAAGLLDELGVAVDVAADGLEALEALRRRTYDLVLMDVQMPRMDGLTATRALRADPRRRDLPIVAMTASALPEDRRACLEAGMDDVVTKPIDPDDLRRALARWLAVVPPAVPGATPPTADALGPLRGLAALDAARGLRYARGRPRLYLDLLRAFLDDQRDLPRLLRQALTGGDAATLGRLAHTCRGLASGLGAGGLAAAAEALEAAVRDRAGAGDLHAATEALVDAHERLYAAVASRGGVP